jgi:hypothetical protein
LGTVHYGDISQPSLYIRSRRTIDCALHDEKLFWCFDGYLKNNRKFNLPPDATTESKDDPDQKKKKDCDITSLHKE